METTHKKYNTKNWRLKATVISQLAGLHESKTKISDPFKEIAYRQGNTQMRVLCTRSALRVKDNPQK
jgi:hypothetical protein